MSLKKILGLTALGLILLVVIAGITAWILIRHQPKWYRPQQLSHEEMLAAEEQMVRTAADFNNASQVAEPFILELTAKQINDMIAVVVKRNNILPSYISQPLIRLANGEIMVAALVSWKGESSVASIRIRPFVDSAGLLHIELDKLKAGALGLPENFLPDTLDKVEQTTETSLAASKSNSDRAQAARKNKDLLARIFTALHGAPVPANFVTREDLQMTIEDIRITPGLLEIQFRPLPTGGQPGIQPDSH